MDLGAVLTEGNRYLRTIEPEWWLHIGDGGDKVYVGPSGYPPRVACYIYELMNAFDPYEYISGVVDHLTGERRRRDDLKVALAEAEKNAEPKRKKSYAAQWKVRLAPSRRP